MPPRKSDARKSDASIAASPHPDEQQQQPSPQEASVEAQSQPSKPEKKDKDVTTIEDLTLPKSIITRLAKGALPPNTQIQANAALAISKSAIVFINYLASHANENTLAANKKTIAPADVFKALDDVEFGFLKEPLEAEFAKFNAIQTEKRTSYRAKVKAAKDDVDTSMQDTSAVGDDHRAKKARVETTGDETEEEDAEIEEERLVEDEDEDDDVEEEDEEEQQQVSGDETQDALEEKPTRDDDEALDGDESD